MATTKLTLLYGSGKGIGKNLWEGECPICKKLSKFSYNFYDLQFGRAVAEGILEVFRTKGKSLISILTSPRIQDIVGCINCRHAMAICPNCQIAFSISKSCTFYICPSCNTKYV